MLTNCSTLLIYVLLSVEGVCSGLPAGPVDISLHVFSVDSSPYPIYIAWNTVSHLIVEEISETLSLST